MWMKFFYIPIVPTEDQALSIILPQFASRFVCKWVTDNIQDFLH